MSSTLSEGVRVPDIGSTSWGADVNYNWGLLNTALANISGNVKTDVANTWTATQTFTETISGSIDGIATRAVGDEDGNNIKTALAGKQSSLSQSQLDAVNSGITAAGVQQIGTNAGNITSLQTAVNAKAADSDVVHLAGAETVTGDKTFTGAMTIGKRSSPFTVVTAIADCSMALADQSSLVFLQTRGSSNFRSYNSFLWSGYRNSTSPDRYGRIRLYRSMGVYGEDNEWTPDTSFSFIDFAIHYKFVNITENVQIINDDTENAIKPVTNNATDLGTSTNKWKTLNGINPGALSLPSDSGVSFSGDITNTTGTTSNSKTWTANGWGYIRIPNSASSNFISVVTPDTKEAYLVTGTGAGNSNMGVSFPIVAGRTYYIYVSTSGNVTAYYFPCLGNV